jgi:uncharacterized membrane protein
MSGHEAGEAQPWHLSKNRIEALTDGIYAVAMTLLVIDLKVPDRHLVHGSDELAKALTELVPKAGAWVLSFFVLAMFWLGHHRLFQQLRVVDKTLLWRNIQQLLLVSLLPFSASLVGEWGSTLEAQYVYNGNMILLSACSLLQIFHVRRHPELLGRRYEDAAYYQALLRSGGLFASGVIAIAIAATTGSVFATYAYLLMLPLGLIRRGFENDEKRQAPKDGSSHRPQDNTPDP